MPWKLISRALTAEGKTPLERQGTPRRLPYSQNSNVWKDKMRPAILKGWDQNSNVYKNRARTSMFGMRRTKFPCL